MWKFLKAGYMEQWKIHTTYSGTPQGSGISPILANIYLSELDDHMEQYKPSFDIGEKIHRVTKEYSRLQGTLQRLRKKYKLQRENTSEQERKAMSKQLRELQTEKLRTPCYPVKDSTYKRLQYNRYADDFVIGIIGSREDAETFKTDVKLFLQERLKLTMSEQKTKISHSSDMVRYLGYDISVSRDKGIKRNNIGRLQRVWYGKVKLSMPHEKWFNKLIEYKTFKIIKDENGKERWKTIHRGNLTNRPEIEIISKFNAEIRGIYNYYRMAQNVSTLDKFANIMKGSMYKTFASKYRTTVNKIRKSHDKDGVFSVDYSTKDGSKRCKIYNDGFKKQKEVMPAYTDTLPQYIKYERKNSLARRLKLRTCELCGNNTDEINMHHVRRLKDLGNTLFSELLMMKKRRKTLALCPICFKQVQARLL